MLRKCRWSFTVRQWDQGPGINQFYTAVTVGLFWNPRTHRCQDWDKRWRNSCPVCQLGDQFSTHWWGWAPITTIRKGGVNIDEVFRTAKLSKLLYLNKCLCKIWRKWRKIELTRPRIIHKNHYIFSVLFTFTIIILYKYFIHLCPKYFYLIKFSN